MYTSSELQIIFGYGLIAFVNALLPTLVSTSAYLIVPYPRPIVIVIQTLPAVAAKSLLPYVLPRVPPWRWFWPSAIALCWVIATFIIDVSPPNVPPWIRVTGVVLASLASGAGEVLWLGMLGLDGKTGLAGWAVGDGLGAVACTGLPHIVTMYMERPLRDGLGYVWYLVPIMLASHYLILSSRPGSMSTTGGRSTRGKETLDYDLESSAHMLRDASSQPENMGARSIKVQSLLRPFAMPLLVAFIGQSMALPGISRAMAVQPIFETHSKFLAAYGGVFHLGSLTARLTFFFFGSPAQKKSLLMISAIASLSLAWLALFPTATMPILCFPAVWLLGAAVGATYVKVFDSAVEQQAHETVADCELRLGFIGVGESLGLVIGGSVGSMLEVSLCGLSVNRGERWCHTAW